MFKIIILSLAGFILYRQLLPLSQLILAFPLNDFSVYRDGVAATLAGANPYTQWWFDRYNYSPAATVLFLPWHYLPVNFAEFTFTAVSLASLWFTLTYILYSLQLKVSMVIKLLLYALLVKLYPAKLTLVLGQVNLIVLFLVSAGYYWYIRRRHNLAGIVLGLATVLKIYPGLLFIFYWRKQARRPLVAGLLTVAIFHTAAIILFGWSLTLHYYSQVVPQLLRQSVNATYMNQGLPALLARLGVFGTLATLIRYLLTGGLLVWLWQHFPKNSLKQFTWYALLLILATLLLPVFVWQHHFVFLIPALLLLIRRSFLASGMYLLLNFYFHNPNLPTQQHPLIATHFLIIAFALTVVLLADLAPRPHRP